MLRIAMQAGLDALHVVEAFVAANAFVRFGG